MSHTYYSLHTAKSALSAAAMSSNREKELGKIRGNKELR